MLAVQGKEDDYLRETWYNLYVCFYIVYHFFNPYSFYRKKLVLFTFGACSEFEHHELFVVDPHERFALMGIFEKN
jgi:hypothetical protein